MPQLLQNLELIIMNYDVAGRKLKNLKLIYLTIYKHIYLSINISSSFNIQYILIIIISTSNGRPSGENKIFTKLLKL